MFRLFKPSAVYYAIGTIATSMTIYNFTQKMISNRYKQRLTEQTVFKLLTNEEIENAINLPSGSVSNVSQFFKDIQINIKKSKTVPSFYDQTESCYYDRASHALVLRTNFHVDNQCKLFSPFKEYGRELPKDIKLSNRIVDSVTPQNCETFINMRIRFQNLPDGTTKQLNSDLKDRGFRYYLYYGSMDGNCDALVIFNDPAKFNEFIHDRNKINQFIDEKLPKDPANIVKRYM